MIERATLETRTDGQRESSRLRLVEQLPPKENAARLGETDGAARVMLARSLKALEVLLVDTGISDRW